MFEVEGATANIEVRTDHLEVAKEFIRTREYISFLPYLCVKKNLKAVSLLRLISNIYLI